MEYRLGSRACAARGGSRAFLRREDAERIVRDWDREAPEQAGLLHVEVIEFEMSAN